MIVGFDTSDDAGVFRLNDSAALVQTVDFFTPVADDPETYGRIAAVNSLNDVYAMGGTPLSALSIVCYPQTGDMDVLGKILLGGQLAMNSENVVVIGGHSVDDTEMKIGYAVTGIVDPGKVIRNSGARPGDTLILTKPIGTGAINTAVKKGVADEVTIAAAISAMTMSAASASKAMQQLGVNACTDITGFGLLGHAYEMAKASNVTLEIDSAQVPLLPNVIELIKKGMLTRGDRNNRAYVGKEVEFLSSVSAEAQSALFDPQTAGGLLISLPKRSVAEFTALVPTSVQIGRVVERSRHLLAVQ